MATFILFTNTPWTEPPRLRHQVTQLLINAGNKVIFFERPRPLFTGIGPKIVTVSNQLTLVNTTRLIHFQLRVVPVLSWLNGLWASAQIRARLRACDVGSDAIVINFNHDFDFLTDVFSRKQIVTLINDDFEAQCRLPWRWHITRMLRRTCQSSGAVLAVSTPLLDRLSQWCTPTLFLPWAVTEYKAPSPNTGRRTTLLFWGSIDNALDLDLVARLANALKARGPQWKMLFVGPTQHQSRRVRILEALSNFSNIEVRDATPLNELPLDEVLCGIMPYANTPAVNAVTLANKSMQLLAHGLPLVISAMPRFVDEPFVRRLDRGTSIDETLDECSANFLKWQPAIEHYLRANLPETRISILAGDGARPSRL